jgi:pimeloyl-ACP methyl ester carboxylesterase
MTNKSHTADKLVVTLIHGTFAPSSDWAAVDSAFARDLSARCGDIDFHRFVWSGSNTIKGREVAAQNLKEHVQEIYERYESLNISHKHHLICHSHGGTVALLACKDLAVSRMVEHVHCIFTPFIYFRFDQKLRILNIFSCLVPVYLLALYFSLKGSEIFFLGVPLPFWVIFSLIGALFIIGKRNRLSSRINSCLVDRLNLAGYPSERINIIRAVGDEAGGLVGLGNFASWLLAAFSWFAVVIGALLNGGGGLLVVVAVLLLSYYFGPVFLFGFLVLALLPILTILRLLLRMVNAFDYPWRCPHLETSLEAVPFVGEFSVTLVDITPRGLDIEAHRNRPLTSMASELSTLVHTSDKHAKPIIDAIVVRLLR